MSETELKNSYQVVMPRLGLTMRDGKILEWLKLDGDLIKKGEPLFSIENEKASLEIEAPAGGILKILVPVNVVVPILTPVGLLTGSDAKSSHHQGKTSEQSASTQSGTSLQQFHESKTGTSATNVRATPKARAAAKKAGIDLSGHSGSGIRSMVILADLAHLENPKVVRATPLARLKAAELGVEIQVVPGSGPRGMVRRADIEQAFAGKDLLADFSAPAQPLGELRSIIASRLGKSWIERPQVTLTTEADATLFLEARKQVNAELTGRQIKLSINALLIKLTAQALVDYPYMNVSLLEEGLIQHPQVNMGLAVDTEPGLMVPVIQNASQKSHTEIQLALEELVTRTLAGHNNAQDLSGSTFTITNLGAFEIDAFTPIINPPECAILGIGRIHSKPVAIGENLVVRSMVTLSLSFDHRLVDGAPAAKFLQRIKQYIEQPFLWTLWQSNC